MVSDMLYLLYWKQCCGSQIPDPIFSHPGSRVKKIPDPRAGLKNLSILTQKDVSKLSEV
jgi:hypothetical protein